MKKDIKVLAADIDGTLVMKGENLLPETRRALEKLHEQGVLIGLATGRPFDRRIQDFARKWGLSFDFDLIIGMNGADLWDKSDDEVDHLYPIRKEAIAKILEFLKPIDHNAIVYMNGYDRIGALRMDEFMKMSIERNHSKVEIIDRKTMAEHDTGKVEVHYNLDQHDQLMELVEKNQDGTWQAVITFPGTIEFQDPRITKGHALEHYARKHGIDLSQVIAFGDMDNDIPLLESAGIGVCLKNGSEKTKKAADEITRYPVEEDGVGRYLFENVL